MKRLFHAFGCTLAVAVFTASQVAAQVVVTTTTTSDQGPMPFGGPNRQFKTGTGKIRGRVMSAETAGPLRRAQVRLSGADAAPKSALTDAQGRYEFTDLPAGRVNISVSKSGFVSMQYGQLRPFEPGKPIELLDAQVLDKADFSLPRGSVISGRVVDEFGEPMAEAAVSSMRLQFVNGRRRLTPSGRTSQTDDLGRFRIYGLPPGDYYVSATLRSMDTLVMDMAMSMAGGGAPSGPTSGYAPTYYPGTANPAEALKVNVAAGQELNSVDISLAPVRLSKITGTALGSDGKPASGAMIMLLPNMRDAMMFMPGGTSRTNKDGQFTLTGVVPGDYTLQLRSLGAIMSEVSNGMQIVFSTSTPDSRTSVPAQPEPEFANMPVVVTGEDINSITVVTSRGAKASGRIVFEGGSKPSITTPIRVSAPGADPDGGPVPGVSGTVVKDTGTFDLSGLSGVRLLRPVGLPTGWTLKSVQVNGADVTDTGLEFKPGEDVSGIDIVLTNKTTMLTGSVTDDKGQSLKDYTVVIFPDDPQKWTLPVNRFLSTARPDQDGRFKVSTLPAGSYYAVAVEYVPQGESSDPDYLQRMKGSATHFALEDGAVRNLDLKLSSGS